MKFRFRDVELDPDTRELSRGGKPVRVQPKVFDFLLYLVRNRERVVPREELLSAVWRDVAVTGASIGRALEEAAFWSWLSSSTQARPREARSTHLATASTHTP